MKVREAIRKDPLCGLHSGLFLFGMCIYFLRLPLQNASSSFWRAM